MITTMEDRQLISQIARRAVDTFISMEVINPRDEFFVLLAINEQLVAVHSDIIPLRLKELLEARTIDLLHDISGIQRHLNPSMTALTDCFIPRYAAKH